MTRQAGPEPRGQTQATPEQVQKPKGHYHTLGTETTAPLRGQFSVYSCWG